MAYPCLSRNCSPYVPDFTFSVSCLLFYPVVSVPLSSSLSPVYLENFDSAPQLSCNCSGPAESCCTPTLDTISAFCISENFTCCGNTFCTSGSICCDDGYGNKGCCPSGTTCSVDGTGCCPLGQTCSGDPTCSDYSSDGSCGSDCCPSSNPYCLYDVPGFGTGCFASNALTNSSTSQNISSVSSIGSITSVTSITSLALPPSTPLSTTLSLSSIALPPPTTAKATTTISSSSSSSSYSAMEWTSAIAGVLCYDPLGLAWTPCPPSFLATYRPSGTATPSTKRSAASGPLSPNLGKTFMALYFAALMLVYHTYEWLQELWAADMNLYEGEARDGDLELGSDGDDGSDDEDGDLDGSSASSPARRCHGSSDDGNSDHYSPSKWPCPRLDEGGFHGTERLHNCASTSTSDHHPLQHAHPSSPPQHHEKCDIETSNPSIWTSPDQTSPATVKARMPTPPTPTPIMA